MRSKGRGLRVEEWGLRVESIFCGLKGQCHEIFCHFLFHESKPSGPRKYRLKWFCLEICFREDIHKICDSAQSRTPRRLTLRRVGNLNVCKSKIG